MLRIISPLLLATLVVSHGHISNIVINGVSYDGWNIDSYPYMSDPPVVVAWGTPNTANGFITPGLIAYHNHVTFQLGASSVAN